MGHDKHFLERLDRVTREQTDFALGLYRDPEAVKYLLGHVSLPDDVPRVALSIADTQLGPFVIVSRQGAFVTCLGTGMSPRPWPVVPRAQIDALLAKVADKRARREFAERDMRHGEEEDSIFHRLVTRGSRMSREDFQTLTAFEALLGTAPFLIMGDLALEVLEMRPGLSMVQKSNGRIAKALEKQDRLTWAVGHSALLSGAGEREDLDELVDLRKDLKTSPTWLCSAMAGHTFLLRSAWLAARLGKAALPLYKQAFESEEITDWIQVFEGAMCIGAIGMRHAHLFDDARRILQAQLPIADADPNNAYKLGRAAFGHWVAQVMDKADEEQERVILSGKEFCKTHSAHLPDGHPLKFERPEDVPDDLAKTAALAWDGDPYEQTIQNFTVHCVVTAARASATDFYFPREVVRAWFGAWDVEEILFRLSRFRTQSEKRKPEPAHATPTPGRNDPCPCGSGKKWKKCHGA